MARLWRNQATLFGPVGGLTSSSKERLAFKDERTGCVNKRNNRLPKHPVRR